MAEEYKFLEEMSEEEFLEVILGELWAYVVFIL